MQCDICFRTGGKEWLCPTDARNILYESRLQNARVLLEKDALDQQTTDLLAPQSKTDSTSSSRADVSASNSERDQAIDRTQHIIAHADEFRAKVDQAREELAKKKAIIARRKQELASASSGVNVRRSRQTEDVDLSLRMTKYKWNQVADTAANSRTFLCGEAAKLYGLRRVRKNGALEEYKIGGIGIVDLRSLNTATPAQISTALSHIVHLLVLSSHYLAIRLPAEITLPHRDYPLPTIFSLTSSYRHSDVPFPGLTPALSSNNSPTTLKHPEQANQPRPRPLFIKKPLPLLANEDPAGYGLFLEAVTLLAYDVAWVCKSQGIPVGEESGFEDICNIGRNVYNLLIGPRLRPSPSSRDPSEPSTPSRGGVSRDSTETAADRRTSLPLEMGRYSHGSTHTFLGSAEGTEFIRSWKLPSPIKLADKLKSRLSSEVANAEWEILKEDAWEVADEMRDDGVVVGARPERERGFALGMQSFMSMRTITEAVEMIGPDGGDRKAGTSGWTKLKPR